MLGNQLFRRNRTYKMTGIPNNCVSALMGNVRPFDGIELSHKHINAHKDPNSS